MTSIAANSSRFSIAIKGINETLRLTRIQGAAQISGIFQYDICFASKVAISDLKDLLDKPVLVTLHDDEQRFVRGYIHHASYLSHGREYTEYQIQIVPRLWWLTQRSNQRIFQEQTPNQIIAEILKEHGIQSDTFKDATKAAPSREYCVQYQETDFAFINRLMQEEGWHYHFQSTTDKQILVLADKNNAFQQKSGSQTIRFEQETSRPQDEECIHELTAKFQITGNSVRISDFNFEKPSLALNEQHSGDNSSLQHYHHPGLFSDPGRGKSLSEIHLQQSQHRQQVISMKTHSIHCDAGQWLEVEKHPNSKLNGKYLIVESRLEGKQPQSLDEGASGSAANCNTELHCIPWSTAFRPFREFTKPTISGPHNAVVTGPAGEEIYTDKYGRIKVQFFWDREGKANEDTSCWLRVNQPIAGLQWGGISLPRIGQEVIIEFEHGDPDRPIMVGRVYNDQNEPPYALPSNKTRSAFKSLSTPKGGGYNEFRIEDKKGSEQIFIRAEKDFDLRVLNMHKQQIDNNQHETVTGTASQELKKDLHQTIGKTLNEEAGQNLSLTVAKDVQLKVSGAHVVQAGNAIHIKAGSKAVIQAGMSLSVKGGAGSMTLDASGVSIMGPIVRINEGGGGGSAQAANPTKPGTPAEADNDAPGAKLQAASGSVTPLPEKVDFDRAAAQLALLKEAKTFNSPVVEECPECALFAAQQAAKEAAAATKEEAENWVDLYYAHADGYGVAGAKYTLYDANTGEVLQEGTLDETGQAKVQLPVDKTNVRVEYHSDNNNELIQTSTSEKKEAPTGWLDRLMNKKQGSPDE